MKRYEPFPQGPIPDVGFRARRWARFERDLREWMTSPEGRFAEWRAHELVTAGDERH